MNKFGKKCSKDKCSKNIDKELRILPEPGIAKRQRRTSTDVKKL